MTRCMTDDERTTYVLQQVYRKHAQNDPDIGWEELQNLVADELASRMGNVAFARWLEEPDGDTVL